MPVERSCVCLLKGLVFVFTSLGGLVNACRMGLCLPVERTYVCACLSGRAL